jgi:hypothetical protein
MKEHRVFNCDCEKCAAQHLKREQKSDCPRCGSDSRNIEITCVHCGYQFAVTQGALRW